MSYFVRRVNRELLSRMLRRLSSRPHFSAETTISDTLALIALLQYPQMFGQYSQMCVIVWPLWSILGQNEYRHFCSTPLASSTD